MQDSLPAQYDTSVQQRGADSESHEDGSPAREQLLTTGDMARRSGSTLRTVRFYEEAGLLKPRERTEGGHRLFTDCELKKLNLISDLRAAGFSLDEIKDLLTVKEQSPSGAHAASSLMEKLDDRLATIGERIDALQRVRIVLNKTKQMVAGCSACDHSPLFPTRCGECEVMSEAGEPAIDVLWKVDR